MKSFRWGICLVLAIALSGCATDVSDDDDVDDEETALVSQEHRKCTGADLAAAAKKCGSSAKVAHCHSNGKDKKGNPKPPSVGCKK